MTGRGCNQRKNLWKVRFEQSSWSKWVLKLSGGNCPKLMEQQGRRPAVRNELDTFKEEQEGSIAGFEGTWRRVVGNRQGGSLRPRDRSWILFWKQKEAIGEFRKGEITWFNLHFYKITSCCMVNLLWECRGGKRGTSE